MNLSGSPCVDQEVAQHSTLKAELVRFSSAFLQTSCSETAHCLPPNHCCLCPKFKVWDTRMSQKLAFYPLPIEKGTSPVERSPDNTKPLAVVGFPLLLCIISQIRFYRQVVPSPSSPTTTKKVDACVTALWSLVSISGLTHRLQY